MRTNQIMKYTLFTSCYLFWVSQKGEYLAVLEFALALPRKATGSQEGCLPEMASQRPYNNLSCFLNSGNAGSARLFFFSKTVSVQTNKKLDVPLFFFPSKVAGGLMVAVGIYARLSKEAGERPDPLQNLLGCSPY